MTVRERIIACRLFERVGKCDDYAKRIGLSASVETKKASEEKGVDKDGKRLAVCGYGKRGC